MLDELDGSDRTRGCARWRRSPARRSRRTSASSRRCAEHIGVAIERFRSVGDRWGLAASLSELASLYMVDGDLDAAEAALVESERLLAELGSGSPSGMTLMRRADLLTRRGDHVAARDLLQEALADAGAQEERQMLMVFLAGTMWRLGDLEGALAVRDEAMRDGGGRQPRATRPRPPARDRLWVRGPTDGRGR